jgi:poly(3-hydroxybutyrate) depolymerase
MRAALALLCLAGVAHAEKPPCERCRVQVPSLRMADNSLPMLVVMHGDREDATRAFNRWRTAAKQARWVLVALDCPRSEGCTNKEHSWWQWGGEPQWTIDRVKELVASLPVDRNRIYLAGWSGGATYLGMRSIHWTDTFAAIVIHGGGQPPWDEKTCPAKPLPAYFFVGDKNPLHHLAKGLRAYLESCKQDVKWDVIKGAAHADEHTALTTKKALQIFDWLDKHARPSTDDDDEPKAAR